MKKGFKIITVDGESACGKSTMGRILSENNNFLHLDAGVLFRSLALYRRFNNQINNELSLVEMKNILNNNFHFFNNSVFFKSKDITALIGTEEVGMYAYQMGQQKEIQEHFIIYQRELVEHLSNSYNGIVISGRISGSVVFPDADRKFYLQAPLKIKAERRHTQLLKSGITGANEKRLINNLRTRDNIFKILPSANLDICSKTVIIDTSKYSLNRLSSVVNAYL